VIENPAAQQSPATSRYAILSVESAEGVASPVVQQAWTMLGDLIANLDRPDVAAAVLTTLDPIVATRIERRAAAAAMGVADFTAGAVRDFVERADDERWLQLLTIMRKAENPGLAAIQAILGWVAADA
jgi:hypothetical protein